MRLVVALDWYLGQAKRRIRKVKEKKNHFQLLNAFQKGKKWGKGVLVTAPELGVLLDEPVRLLGGCFF